jgi:hypothetical protein
VDWIAPVMLETAERTLKYCTLDFTAGTANAARVIPTANVMVSSRSENPEFPRQPRLLGRCRITAG